VPAVRVLDCVLSLNRRYKFVLSRIDPFEKKHPEIRSISDLKAFIASRPSAHEFFLSELNYDDKARADTLNAVVSWLAEVAGTGSEEAQLLKLESWARTAKPEDYILLGIRGFKLAGFQFLRMRFGANTTKPDVHIIKFVNSHLGHPVTAEEALHLLESSAAQAGIHLRDLDSTIWEERARPWL
jgi:hypothetical protein